MSWCDVISYLTHVKEQPTDNVNYDKKKNIHSPQPLEKALGNRLAGLLTFIGVPIDLSRGQTQSRVISAFLLRPSPTGGLLSSSGYTITSLRRKNTATKIIHNYGQVHAKTMTLHTQFTQMLYQVTSAQKLHMNRNFSEAWIGQNRTC